MRPIKFCKPAFRKAALCLLLCTTFFTTYHAVAQISNAPFNVYQPVTTNVFSNLTVTSSQVPVFGGDQFSPKANVIDGDAGNANSASWTGLLGGTAWLEVKDNNATGGAVYPGGSYAGFVISTSSLLGLSGSSVQISTYLGSNPTGDTYTANDALLAVSLLSANTPLKVGFVTTQAFDRVRITITNGLSLLPTWSIYNAEILRSQAGPVPSCNTNQALVQNAYPAVVTTGTTGLATATLLSGGIFTNTQNVTDANTGNAATITLPVGALSSAYISVREAGAAGAIAHPAGYFAGFEVANNSLLALGLLNNSTITTYLDGVQKETVTGNNLLLSVPLLSGNGKATIGFVTTQPFNEVRYTMTQPVSVSLGTTSVYNAVIKQFCAGTLVCNTPTAMNASQQPVYIDAQNTGFTGAVSVSNSLSGLDNVIDGNPATAATMTLAAGALSTGSVAVRDAITTYSAGTFAGFDVEASSLVNVNASLLSSAVTLEFFNNGVSTGQTVSGAQLLAGVSSTTLFGGGTRQTVGAIATAPFDEVKISFNQTASVNLGTIYILDAIWQRNCISPIPCNTSILLKVPDYGVVIDGARTGISGLIGAGSYVQDAGNVIDQDATNYARMHFIAGVANQGSIAVASGANVFPGGTYAGFLIRDNAAPLLLADLLKGITVTTYRNGAVVESKTSTNLLALTAVIPLISTSGMKEVGFMTTPGSDFDEIRITVDQLVTAALPRTIDVFGAVIDTRYVAPGTSGLNCTPFQTNPDINYTTINKPVAGSVATNDKVPAGTTYSNAVPVNGADGTPNPPGATISLNPDGTYTFTATTVGVYSYSITVCNGTTCEDQNLTITVTDPASTTNPPIVNTDIAATNAGTPVTVNVLANDRAGNTGGTLGTPVISGNPSHGTAVVNGNGTVTYTPEAGFVGKDTITYTTCENPGNICSNAYVIVEVKPTAVNTTTAADDFNKTAPGAAVTGNVKTNDIDPEGDTQSITPQDITTAAGHFVLAADGSYTFTPAAGYTGTAQFTYNTCDNNPSQACALATLYVAVTAPDGADLTPRISLNPNNVIGVSAVEVTVQISEVGNKPTTGIITVYVDKLAFFNNFSFNPSATVNIFGLPVQNSLFSIDAVSNPNFYIITTNASFQNSARRAMFTLTADPQSTKGRTSVNVLIQAGSGGEVNGANNSSYATITYSY